MIFDPHSATFLQNPYPIYDQLRERSAIFFHEATQLWYVTSYAHASSILRDRRFGRDMTLARPSNQCPISPPNHEPFTNLEANSLFDKEPPDHTRLRGLVQLAFTPRRVHAMRPRIQQITDQLLDNVTERGSMELLADFAEPLPIAVISEMLGIPEEDRHRLRPWSNAIVAMYELERTPAQTQAAVNASQEFTDYLRHLANQRRAKPQDDLITALVCAEGRGSGGTSDSLTEDELISTCVLLLNAGHEATVNVIGNGILALLQNPDQLHLLQHDSTLIDSTIEELMRYDTPLQLFRRWVIEDVEVGGHHFHRGQEIGLIFGAANRDPARYHAPHNLDIRRQDNSHLALSEGIHFCLGASLARLELQVAIGTLVRRFPKIQLVEEPHFKSSWVIRGLEALRMKWQ